MRAVWKVHGEEGAIVILAGIAALLLGTVGAKCPHFSGNYENIYVNEDGTWRGDWKPQDLDANAVSDITIDQDNPIGQYFTAAKNQEGDKWLLTYKEGLSDWYDTPDPGDKPRVP